MKAVSVHQPWAWAILQAGKNVENRSWRTHHRGPLLVHAAKSRASYDAQDPARWLRLYGVVLPAWNELTTGAILGVVDVVGCVEVGPGGRILLSSEVCGEGSDEAMIRHHNREVARPAVEADRPARLFLEWHREEVFRGRVRT